MTIRLGLIGAGLMGHGIGRNFLKANYPLAVIAHNNRQPIDDLVAHGAIEYNDLQSLAQNSDVIVLCLSNSDIVNQVVSELKDHLTAGQCLLDMGTSRPENNIALSEELKKHNIMFAESPVAGGPEQALQGKLGAMVGADSDCFEIIEPILKTCCERISHFGPVGSGQSAKLISNYLVCSMIALITDSFSIARDCDLDWQKLFDVIQMGSGNSGVLQKMITPALGGDFDGYRFAINNADKDLGYFIDMLNQRNLSSQLATPSKHCFSEAINRGHGNKNVSQLLRIGPED